MTETKLTRDIGSAIPEFAMMLRAYAHEAVWSAGYEYLGDIDTFGITADDIPQETLDEMAIDCAQFLASIGTDAVARIRGDEMLGMSHLGACLWAQRNHTREPLSSLRGEFRRAEWGDMTDSLVASALTLPLCHVVLDELRNVRLKGGSWASLKQ